MIRARAYGLRGFARFGSLARTLRLRAPAARPPLREQREPEREAGARSRSAKPKREATTFQLALASSTLLIRPVIETDDQRILLTQARPGMVLSRPVVSAARITLCAAGTELTLDLIDRLANRGVKRLWVAGHPLPPPRPEDFLAFLDNLRRRFSRCDLARNQTMAELRKSVERCLVRRM
jgi:hypothetical protein